MVCKTAIRITLQPSKLGEKKSYDEVQNLS